MSDKKKTIRHSGWGGGLFSNLLQDGAQQNQLLQADNCIIDEFDNVSQRYGFTCQNSESAANIVDLFVFENDPYASGFVRVWKHLSNKNLVWTVLKGISSPAPTDEVIHTYTEATPSRGKFIFFNGFYVHTNGVDKIQSWIGSGAPVTSADALGAPISRVLHPHNDRVFCAVANTLYETAPGTGPDHVTDNFATGASWRVGLDNDDWITGLGSIDRDLYILKRKSIWIQTGYTLNERQTVKISDVGCIAPHSIRQASINGIGSVVVFVSSLRKLCLIYNKIVIDIGECVQAELDRIITGYLPENTNFTMMNCTSEVVDSKYFLGIASGTSVDVNSAYTRCLIVDLNKRYQSKFGDRYAAYVWLQATSEYLKIQFGAMFAYNSTDWGGGVITVSTLFLGMFDNKANKYKVAALASKQTLDLTASFPSSIKDVDSNGVQYAITMTIKTRNDSAGDDQEYKNFSDAIIKCSFPRIPAGTTKTITVTQTNDQDSAVMTETVTQVATTINKVYHYDVGLVNDARECSITVSTATLQTIHGIDINYTKGANI